MDVDDALPAGQSTLSREKVLFHAQQPMDFTHILQTTPFLIRTFVKIGSFHRLTLFEDGALPTTDEQQIFTWYVMIPSFITYY